LEVAGTGAMHTLTVNNNLSTSELSDGLYGFYLTNGTSTLTDYFSAKGWTDSSWYTQINQEITGGLPFFYLKYDSVVGYTLVDGFQYGLSSGTVVAPLVIDDNYPAGTYTFWSDEVTGVNGDKQEISITLNVTHLAD
jgi:hypothetical protein